MFNKQKIVNAALDFTRLSEKNDKVCARIGKNLLLSEGRLFKVWHEFKQSRITRDELLRQSWPIRQHIGELLEQGSYTDPLLKIARFCKNLLKDYDALWLRICRQNCFYQDDMSTSIKKYFSAFLSDITELFYGQTSPSPFGHRINGSIIWKVVFKGYLIFLTPSP